MESKLILMQVMADSSSSEEENEEEEFIKVEYICLMFFCWKFLRTSGTDPIIANRLGKVLLRFPNICLILILNYDCI